MTTGSDLDVLLVRQKLFMEALGIDPNSGTLLTEDVPSKDEEGAAISVAIEAAEILELVNKANRVWKTKEFNTAAEMKEEMIDVVFFILELAVFLDLSGEDLVRLYNEKYRINLTRLYNARIKRGEPISPVLSSLMQTHFTANELEIINEKLGV